MTYKCPFYGEIMTEAVTLAVPRVAVHSTGKITKITLKMMRLIRIVKWYFRIKKLRRTGPYPCDKRHIWSLAKFMSNESKVTTEA